MSFAIKFPLSSDIPKIDDFPSVPDWVVKRIPKNKRVHLNYNYTKDEWSINGKAVARFDKKLTATAIEHAIKVRQGGAAC